MDYEPRSARAGLEAGLLGSPEHAGIGTLIRNDGMIPI